MNGDSPATGRCLCGAVGYEVRGQLRDVVVCHCVECRRWNGGAVGYAAAPRDAVRVIGEPSLQWIDSPHSNARARRGFCRRCGSSLFWDSPERDTISIAAGTLEQPTGLATIRHIYTEQAGDYESGG